VEACSARLGSDHRQGVALMRLAERKKDMIMAETAYRQIEAALNINRTDGYAPFASYYEKCLSECKAILNRLKVS
jgi:hypothetical protein